MQSLYICGVTSPHSVVICKNFCTLQVKRKMIAMMNGEEEEGEGEEHLSGVGNLHLSISSVSVLV